MNHLLKIPGFGMAILPSSHTFSSLVAQNSCGER
jgi:hypothetical protein